MRGKVPFCSTSKHPWLLLTVCWQCAQPLEIATERHALFLERSDEVSLDVQLWTCANSLRIYATACSRPWCEASPSCGTKSDAAGRALLGRACSSCVLPLRHMVTLHWTHPYLLVLSFVRLYLPSVTLSHISRSLVHVFLWSVPTFSKLDLQSCSSLNALRYVTDPVTFLDRTRDTYGCTDMSLKTFPSNRT